MKTRIRAFWKRVTNIGVTDALSSGEAKRVRLVNRIGIVVALFMVPFVFQYLDMGLPLATATSVFSIACMLLSVWLNSRAYYLSARYLILIGGGLVNIFVISSVMGFENGDHTALTMAVLFTFMLFDLKQRRHLVFGLIATVACWIGLEATGYEAFGNFDIDGALQRTNYTVTFTLSLFCVMLMAFYFQNLSNRQVDDIVFRAQQELKAVFNNAYDAIFLVHPRTLDIEECNERSLEMFTIDEKELILGTNANLLLEQPFTRQELAEVKRRPASGHKWSVERKLKSPGTDPFWGNIAFTTVRFGERDSLLVRISDITEKKLAEVQMRQARDKAEAANQAKDNFLANMSHELRTPLNGILGMTQLIQMTSTDAALQEYAQLLWESGGRLLNVFNTMLDLSKLETSDRLVDLEPTNVAPLLRTTTQLFAAEAEAKGLAFELDLPEGEVITLLEKDFFEKSMAQVLSNALKFTESGQIKLSVAQDEEEAVSITVSDTGIGMSQEFLDNHLFTKFKQESGGYTRKYEGAGLGLALTKRMTELMQGEIEVKSQKEIGTAVILRFKNGG